jgi:flagellar basal body L-ring protein FlgH
MTGIIRPVDILNGNTVLSQFVSNFSVSYVGKGPETQFTRYGFFGQAMNIIWPF